MPLSQYSISHLLLLGISSFWGSKVRPTGVGARLELTFDGPLGRTLTANTDMPQYDPEGVLVALSWERLKAKLYLQGCLVETKDISRRTLH